MWVQAGVDSGTGGTIVQYQSTIGPRGPWSGRTTALGYGTPGSWDDHSTGVPFVWYEAGQTRPWRMLYSGSRTSDGMFCIGLATSVDGITWQREDTAGNPLPVIPISSVSNDGGQIEVRTSAPQPWSTGAQIILGGMTGTGVNDVDNNGNYTPQEWTITVIDNRDFVLQGSTYNANHTYVGGIASQPVLWGVQGQWDNWSIDFGGVIEVGTTYYIYYDNICLTNRQVGLATSTDLVHWTKSASNPLWTGVSDYSDKNHVGTPDPNQGFYCPDIVRWDSPTATRYVAFLLHRGPHIAQDRCLRVPLARLPHLRADLPGHGISNRRDPSEPSGRVPNQFVRLRYASDHHRHHPTECSDLDMDRWQRSLPALRLHVRTRVERGVLDPQHDAARGGSHECLCRPSR